jgi:TRAP-type C4-dicarboxylate transport system permease small subunit
VILADPVTDEPLVLRLVGRLVDLAVVLCGAGVAVLVFGNVLARFVAGIDVAWSGELAAFLLVWGTFLGGAAAARRRAHMRVSELVGMLDGAPRRCAEATINLAVAGLLGIVVWYGVIIVQLQWPQQTTVLYWPYGLLYLAMPVGAALTLLFVLHDTVRIARGRAHPADPPITA